VCVPGFDEKMHFVAESGVWGMKDGVFGFGRVGFDFVLRCSAVVSCAQLWRNYCPALFVTRANQPY